MPAASTDFNALLAMATAAFLVAGCNSPTDNNNGSSTTDASATGVWSGSDSVTGLAITAFIDSAGQAVFLRSDGVQFTGAVQVSGSTLAVTVDATATSRLPSVTGPLSGSARSTAR